MVSCVGCVCLPCTLTTCNVEEHNDCIKTADLCMSISDRHSRSLRSPLPCHASCSYHQRPRGNLIWPITPSRAKGAWRSSSVIDYNTPWQACSGRREERRNEAERDVGIQNTPDVDTRPVYSINHPLLVDLVAFSVLEATIFTETYKTILFNVQSNPL